MFYHYKYHVSCARIVRTRGKYSLCKCSQYRTVQRANADQYWLLFPFAKVVAPHRDKSCGRVADKFGLRTWILGFTRLVFKTTYIDSGKLLRDGAFFFTRTILFPPLDKRNTRDKAKGKAYHFGEVYRGVGCANLYRSVAPLLRRGC